MITANVLNPLKSRFQAVLCGLLLSLAHVTVAAADNGPGLSVSADRTTVTVGDEIRFSVLVRCPPGYSVLPPEVSGNLGSFLVKSMNSIDRTDKGQKQAERGWTFVLASFTTGRSNIPALTIHCTGPDGRDEPLTSHPLAITVVSVLGPATNVDIRDLKPQMTMKDKWFWLKFSVVILLLAAGGFAFVWWKFLRKRPFEELLAPRVPGLPADQEAIEALDRIIAAGILEKEGVKQYYTLVNEVLRAYFGRRFGFVTLERTSEEILESLSGLYIDRDTVAEAQSFMEESDLVKFAKLVPTGNGIKAFTDRAYGLIHRTRPAPGQAAEAKPGIPGEDGAGS